MSNLTLSDPFLIDPFESAWRRFFTPSLLETQMPPLRMPVDVAERDGTYEIKADLPGLSKDEINVRIDGNLVQIDAQAAQAKDEKASNDKILRCERFRGTISRTFSMAEDIDDANVQAKYVDGVLILELPKKPSSAFKKITVQ